MFVRIVWNSAPALPPQPRDWRNIRHLPRTNADDLGIPAPDFSRMTKGLFDKAE